MRATLFYLLLILFHTNCSKKSEHEISFYYWKQNYSLSTLQKEILKTNNSKKLYVRFFDVTWNSAENKAIPVSKTNFKQKETNLKIIPCIFIENQVFKNKNIEYLPSKVYRLIQEISKNANLSIDEIQIDCDWTDITRKAYFEFLSKLIILSQNKQVITSTLRLHQFKYPKKTGVPPVKKAVLMCYNMGKIDDVNASNSIISEIELRKYILESDKYPLPLDLALPSFHWGLIYRLGKLTLIINDIDRNSLKSFAFNKLSKNKFRADSSFYYNNIYFCKDDILRIEESDPSTLMRCAEEIAESKHRFNTIIFYHLSSNSISSYEKNFFSNISSVIN